MHGPINVALSPEDIEEFMRLWKLEGYHRLGVLGVLEDREPSLDDLDPAYLSQLGDA
jgi:hypothetical protein